MSSKDDNSGVWLVLGALGMAIIIIALFVFALMAFAATVLTILCFLAWRRPLKLGSAILEPEQARAFVHRGIAGAIAVPAFFLFSRALFGWDDVIDGSYLFYGMIGGYCIGAFWPMFTNDADESSAPLIDPATTNPQGITSDQPRAPAPDTRPFDFARWDDEEAQR